MITYKIVILISMILFHIIEDFHLQGILANMKQKKWWENELIKSGTYNEQTWKKYRKDYMVSLIVHSIENSIFILLPIIVDFLMYTIKSNPNNSLWIVLIVLLVFNSFVHYFTDTSKCNYMKFNLVIDQIIHLMSIVTCFIFSWKYIGLWLIN